MSEEKPPLPPETPPQGAPPSLAGELLSLAKLILGVCLIAFGNFLLMITPPF